LKLLIGAIVHFYTLDPARQFNGNGPGPYPAIVTQTWGSDVMANLKVLPGFGAVYDCGSVHHKDVPERAPLADYWEWPPEDVPRDQVRYAQ